MNFHNPSFEGSGSGEWTRDTHTGVEYGEIFVPVGWVAWWEENEYGRPEMKVIPRAKPFLDPLRIADGNWAFQAFTMFHKQNAGLYQIVTNLTPDKRYRLTAKAHAWSAHQGELDVPSPHCSAGVGCYPVYIKEEDVPPINGVPLNDAIGNFRFNVGVSMGSVPDPFGGNVQWGARACIYNGYYDVPPLEFVAPPGGTVVIYLRAQSLWNFRTSDAYWDDVRLELIGAPTKNCARVPYDKTALLLPPDAAVDEVTDLIRDYWEEDIGTFTRSADDAAVGCGLKSKFVVTHRPEAWPGGMDGLRTFYDTFYPDVVLTSTEPPVNSIILSMKDDRWKDRPFAEGCVTIGGQGCYITSLAMALRYYGIDMDATPVSVDEALDVDDYAYDPVAGCRCRPKWSAIKEKLGLEISAPANVDDHLAQGCCVMAEVKPTSLEHFVLVVHNESGLYWMYDPIDGDEGWLNAAYDGVESWRLVKPVESTHEHRTLITGHLQGNAGAMQRYLQVAQPVGLKMLAWDIRNVINWYPGLEWLVLRKWYGNSPANHYFLDHGDKAQAAKEYCDIVLPGLAQEIAWLQSVGWNGTIGVESLNESYCTLCDDNRKSRDFEIAFMHEIMSRNLPMVVPVVMCAAVGNPHETEFESILLPIARVCEQYGGAFGYHPYHSVENGVSYLDDLWIYLAGRWEEMDKVFVANGVHVNWCLGEAGATWGPAPNHMPTPYDGWKSSKVYNENWAVTGDELVYLNNKGNIWNSRNGDRLKTISLFTTGGGDKWKKFEISNDEWNALAVKMATS